MQSRRADYGFRPVTVPFGMMPMIRQAPESTAVPIHVGTSRSAAGRFHFYETDSNEECSLSTVMAQSNWDRLLPESSILAKYVKNRLSNPNYRWNSAINITNGFVSFLFLTAAIGLFTRFVVHVSTPALKAQEDDSESARVFLDILGYYAAPFIITLLTSVFNQIMLIKSKQEAQKKYESIMADYKILRKEYIGSHNLRRVFFTLAETIYELQNIQVDLTYYSKILEIEKKLNENLKLIDHKFNILEGTTAQSLTQLSASHIIDKFKQLLLEQKFSPILSEIKKYIKKNIIDLISQSMLISSAQRIRSDYSSQIDRSPFMQSVLLDIIGEISNKRRRHSSSIFLERIKITEESTLSSIKEALVDYWNDPELKTPLIYPYDIDLMELAVLINIRMKDFYPGLMIQTATPATITDGAASSSAGIAPRGSAALMTEAGRAALIPQGAGVSYAGGYAPPAFEGGPFVLISPLPYSVPYPTPSGYRQ